jgi:hypothetical protein
LQQDLETLRSAWWLTSNPLSGPILYDEIWPSDSFDQLITRLIPVWLEKERFVQLQAWKQAMQMKAPLQEAKPDLGPLLALHDGEKPSSTFTADTVWDTTKGAQLTQRALIDTGCSISCISWHHVALLGAVDLISLNGSISLRSATNGVMKSIGTLQCTFTLAETKCTYTFCVLQELPYDVIFGMNFLHDYHVVLDGRKRQLSLQGELNFCELRSLQCTASLAPKQCVPA